MIVLSFTGRHFKLLNFPMPKERPVSVNYQLMVILHVMNECNSLKWSVSNYSNNHLRDEHTSGSISVSHQLTFKRKL